MTELQQKYTDAVNRIKAAQEEARSVGKKAFQEAAQLVFDEYTDLDSFGWRQYTPYFNDGDECVFGVHCDDLDLVIAGEEHESIYCHGAIENRADEIAQKLYAFVSAFDDDTMKHMFGDHVQIVVKRDGTINVDNYEHE